MMDYQDALKKIPQGRCLLILGSGFSCGCENVIGGNMPRADELCSYLDKLSGVDSEGDLAYATEKLEEAKGKEVLLQTIRDLFTAGELSEEHNIIAAQPWLRVYTTNYDDIMEKGARVRRKLRLEAVTLNSSPNDYINKRNLIVHLNGSVDNLTVKSLEGELRLNSVSYLTDTFKDSPWIDLFEFDISDADAIFIVGLSMEYDLDLARLVYAADLKDKTFIITWEGDKDSRRKLEKLSKFGEVLPIGREQFAKDIENAIIDYVPAEKYLLKLHSFDLFELSLNRPVMADDVVRDLLLWGNVNDNALQFSVREPHNFTYFIYRDHLDTAIKLIKNGERNIVVHGNIGNGKTMLVKGLATILTTEGYKVYFYKKGFPKVYAELEQLCSTADKKTVIIVENYNLNREFIERFKVLRGPVVLVATERTSANDLHVDWLEEQLGTAVKQFDLNRLSDGEISGLIKMVDSVNLWGDLAADRPDKKRKFVEERCRCELRSLLLQLLKTKTVSDHLQEVFQKIGRGDNLRSIVLMMMATYASFNLSLNDISRLVKDDFINSTRFQRNDAVKEFINFSTGEPKATSAVFAEYVLKTFITPEFLCETLVDAYCRFDSNRGRYEEVLISLRKHSNILALLGQHSEVAKKLIPDFYGAIKDCISCRTNPHFWMQYAIALLECKNYPGAEIYFMDAYAYAKNRDDFNTIQIDNHYARFLLERAVECGDQHFWDSFKRAHQILTDHRYIKDKKHYPFKVSRHYRPFFERFRTDMSAPQVAEFKCDAEQLYKMLETYEKTPGKMAIPKEVAEAKKVLEWVLRQSITVRR